MLTFNRLTRMKNMNGKIKELMYMQ